MGVAILELVLVTPRELLREALLNLLVGQALADARVDFVQIFDGRSGSRDVLHGADRSSQLGGPNLRLGRGVCVNRWITAKDKYDAYQLRFWAVGS